MKKIALFCAVAAVALGVMAGDGLKFKFRSSGDTYADGTAVQDGEVYALIWVKSGASFAGFNADGTLADAANNDLAAVSVAQGGGCITTVFFADEKEEAGAYYLYMLDTRTVSVDGDGNVTKTAKGLVDGKITQVSEALEVKNADLSLATTAVSTVVGSETAAVAAVVDESTVAKPVVSGFTLAADGGAVLKVSGTVPYVQYTVYGGGAPDAIGKVPLATFLNGKAGGDLELKVPAEKVDGCKFFKVATK